MERNRPGRRGLDDDGGHAPQVGLRLPARDFDRIYERAKHDGVSMAERIRRDIKIAEKHTRK